MMHLLILSASSETLDSLSTLDLLFPDRFIFSISVEYVRLLCVCDSMIDFIKPYIFFISIRTEIIHSTSLSSGFCIGHWTKTSTKIPSYSNSMNTSLTVFRWTDKISSSILRDQVRPGRTSIPFSSSSSYSSRQRHQVPPLLPPNNVPSLSPVHLDDYLQLYIKTPSNTHEWSLIPPLGPEDFLTLYIYYYQKINKKKKLPSFVLRIKPVQVNLRFIHRTFIRKFLGPS